MDGFWPEVISILRILFISYIFCFFLHVMYFLELEHLSHIHVKKVMLMSCKTVSIVTLMADTNKI